MKATRGINLCAINIALLCGCARQTSVSTTNRPPAPLTDRVLIKKNNQAAMQALSSDHQAVTRASSQPAATQATEQLVSSLKTAVATITPSKWATTRPTENNVNGTVTFTQVGSTLIVVAELSGLEANSTHSVEIHDVADLSAPDLSSTGGLWNANVKYLEELSWLGNVDADAAGKVYFERTLGQVMVDGANSVVGHSIVVRAAALDPQSSASNACIAGGVIERRE